MNIFENYKTKSNCEIEKSLVDNLEEYECIGKIGEGNYGIVYKIKNILNGNDYAIKIVTLSDDLLQNQEKIFFENCNCFGDGILTPIQIIQSNDPPQIGFIMELMDGDLTNLSEILKTNDNDIKYKVFSNACLQIRKGLEILHSKGILHSDLKPQNILFKYGKNGKNENKFENMTFKISDFGLSCFIINKEPSCNNKFGGTISYMDPVNIIDQTLLNRY
jgi:serine/threonine protein kinase